MGLRTVNEQRRDLVCVEDYDISPKPSAKQILSPLDMNMPRLYGNRWILCFPLSLGEDHAVLYEKLREGLAHTIACIPWIAGNIGPEEGSSPENSRIQITNGAGGVEFRCKDLTKILPSYVELKGKNFPYFKLTTALTSPIRVVQTFQPVFAAQANFIKGGLLLTVVAHHSACDSVGLDSILDTWAVNTSVVGTPRSFCEYDPISNDRTPLCRGLPANIADFPEYLIQPSPPNERLHMAPPTCEMPPMVSKIFYFSPENILDLKAATKSYLTYDSILAFFWQHMTKARNPTTHATEHKKTSSVCFAVDVRSRTSPPLPPTYFGNAIVGGITKRLTAANLTDTTSGLRVAAAAIRSAVNASKEPLRIPLTIGLLSSRPNPQDFKFASNAFLGPDLTATSWVDIRARDREWGVLGKPEGFRMPYEGADGTIALLPRMEGGGLEVMAALEGKAMERMVEDEEFLKFAVDWA